MGHGAPRNTHVGQPADGHAVSQPASVPLSKPLAFTPRVTFTPPRPPADYACPPCWRQAGRNGMLLEKRRKKKPSSTPTEGDSRNPRFSSGRQRVQNRQSGRSDQREPLPQSGLLEHLGRVDMLDKLPKPLVKQNVMSTCNMHTARSSFHRRSIWLRVSQGQCWMQLTLMSKDWLP